VGSYGLGLGSAERRVVVVVAGRTMEEGCGLNDETVVAAIRMRRASSAVQMLRDIMLLAFIVAMFRSVLLDWSEERTTQYCFRSHLPWPWRPTADGGCVLRVGRCCRCFYS